MRIMQCYKAEAGFMAHKNELIQSVHGQEEFIKAYTIHNHNEIVQDSYPIFIMAYN